MRMLKQNVTDLLIGQIGKELYSAYLYLDMSNYYHHANLDGFGNWFRIQAKEELDHAMLFLQYLQNNSIKVTLGEIPAPSETFSDFRAPLAAALKHEQYVTSLIDTLYRTASGADDFRTLQFLDWFVKEQGEEEKNTEALLGRFDLFGTDPTGLYMLDSELKSRTYNPPSLVLD